MPHPEHTFVSLPSKQLTDHMHVLSTERERQRELNMLILNKSHALFSEMYLQYKQR